AAPRAGPRAEQDPRGAALWRDEVVLPGERGRIFRQLLRLLPARSLCAPVGHVHREGKLGERSDRPDAALGDALAAGARRRDHRRLGLLSLRHRFGRDLQRDDLRSEKGPGGRPARDHPQARRAPVQAQRRRLRARRLPGTRRQPGDLSVAL
ncbi:hypothetical protein QP64_00130, partial [Staphylococcus aureus]